MEITILDGYTANPGDLSWAPLEAFGTVNVYNRTPRELIAERARDAEIVLTNKTVLERNIIDKLPKLRYIGVLATGYNVVDIEAATEKGIIVTNVPAYSTDSVAQMVFALILEITNGAGHYAEENRKGRWSHSEDFCYWDSPLIELAGKTLGIIGFGNIGSTVADIALAFKMKVRTMTSKAQKDLPAGVVKTSLEDLFRTSDIVSLHCPLTKENYHLINEETLALMKPTAILINTGRGGLVNENALAQALNNGRLYAAGVDVVSEEPILERNPLISARNCYITPHIAWASYEARKRLIQIAIDNVTAFLDGNPENVINSKCVSRQGCGNVKTSK